MDSYIHIDDNNDLAIHTWRFSHFRVGIHLYFLYAALKKFYVSTAQTYMIDDWQ